MSSNLLRVAYFTMPTVDATALVFALAGGDDMNWDYDSNGLYYILCNTSVELTFEIGGKTFLISPLDYVGPVVDLPYCLSYIKPNDTYCSDGTWELGTGFLRNVLLPQE
jgi:hypothetical protein